LASPTILYIQRIEPCNKKKAASPSPSLRTKNSEWFFLGEAVWNEWADSVLSWGFALIFRFEENEHRGSTHCWFSQQERVCPHKCRWKCKSK
jgi:hypothetical protein